MDRSPGLCFPCFWAFPLHHSAVLKQKSVNFSPQARVSLSPAVAQPMDQEWLLTFLMVEAKNQTNNDILWLGKIV